MYSDNGLFIKGLLFKVATVREELYIRNNLGLGVYKRPKRVYNEGISRKLFIQEVVDI
ncbi:hypothetical protein GCM10011351_12140 [Paraliobacillus quinghaiensis]|uniref:Uncharacterized protein n=1 Tax=Paraliobacillus quinghaiensis TaxID=470815 RepID=A0A917TNU6_9BACI|nr:hypothetical protein GCM10011351_12140 [Paraliobacillus quinghaiensis]